MTIKLQDQNLIVRYLQIYLREKFGITLVKSEGKYTLSQNIPLKVTGVFNEQTYLSLGLFMFYNYPNEKYPERVDYDSENTSVLTYTPFEVDRLIQTMVLLQQNHFRISDDSQNEFNNIIASVTVRVSDSQDPDDLGIHVVRIYPDYKLYSSPISTVGTLLKSFGVPSSTLHGEVIENVVNSRVKVQLFTYDDAGNKIPVVETLNDGSTHVIEGWIAEDTQHAGVALFDKSSNPDNYLSYSDLLKYFDDTDRLDFALSLDRFSQDSLLECVKTFLIHNIELSRANSEVIRINSRVISYILEEVVTPISNQDEILRVQKLIYPQGLSYQDSGVFENISHNFNMTERVRLFQQRFVDNHTTLSGSTTLVRHFPHGFEDFKVTGYVDPWTELIIRGGTK